MSVLKSSITIKALSNLSRLDGQILFLIFRTLNLELYTVFKFTKSGTNLFFKVPCFA